MSEEQIKKSPEQLNQEKEQLLKECGDIAYQLRALPGLMDQKLMAISEINKELAGVK